MRDYLQQFPRRMKTVGLYAKLINNIIMKNRWSSYGLEDVDLRINIVFSVLLHIMEYNLRDQDCSLDDISDFVEEIMVNDYGIDIIPDDARILSDFIVNTVLSNEGKVMRFTGHNYTTGENQDIPVSYITNYAIASDTGRKTAYKMTYDGYSLVLGTMEVEDNLKIPISEMILQQQIENQDYEKALVTVKQIFAQLLALIDKLDQAELRIKRNVAAYSVEDYQTLISDNEKIMKSAHKQLNDHRQAIKNKTETLLASDVDLTDPEIASKIHALNEMDEILKKELETIQNILKKNLSYYQLYMEAVENQLITPEVKRFQIKTDLYDRIIQDPDAISNFDLFLKPLLFKKIDKMLNINKVFDLQMTLAPKEEATSDVFEDIDEEAILEAQRLEKEAEYHRYHDAMLIFMRYLNQEKTITLSSFSDYLGEHPRMTQKFMPDLETLKGLLVSFLKADVIDVHAMRHEATMIDEEFLCFELNRMVLTIVNEEHLSDIQKINFTKRAEDATFIYKDEKQIRCTDLTITIEGEDAWHKRHFKRPLTFMPTY